MLDLARVAPDFARVELDFARVAPDFARDRVPLLARLLLERELLDERRLEDRRRDEPPLRSAAGISSRATAFASCSICFSRNFAIRSSSRLMPRASFAVSLSPTV